MALQDALLKPFTWGEGGRRMTPEEAERERALIEALYGKVDTSPVGHWTQGAARVADALAGSFRRGRVESAEEKNRATNKDLLASLMGGVGGSSPAASFSPSVSTAPATPAESVAPMTEEARITGRIDQAHGDSPYRDAIASIESVGSGDYAAIGPKHPELGRAIGRYQVMEANIGPWTEKYLGRRMSTDEFLASPEAQDAVFDGEFGSYVEQYGPEGAAQAWFGGEGGVGKLGREDSLGTSIGEYTEKFNAAVGAAPTPAMGAANAMAQQPVQVAQSGGINPAIMEALTSPYANEQTQGLAKILLEHQLQSQDPMRALELERAQLELQQLRNPVGDPFTLSPGQQRFDAKGNLVAAGGPDTGAPTVQTFYDPKTGQEYKGQWNPQTGDWDRVGGSKAPGGMSIRTNPDGTFEMVSGGKKLTENQSKMTLFRSLQTETQPVLLDLESQWNPANLTDAAARSTPIAGNFFQSEEGQMYQAAATAWAEGALRIATGAAATPEEMQRTIRAYFAQPGDTPNTIAFKAQMREMYDRSIQRALGEEAEGTLPKPSVFADEVTKSAPNSGKTSRDGQPAPEGVDPEDWAVMTPEERSLWQ